MQIISIKITGINKNPGIPNPSIHLTVLSYWNILFIPENKKTDEIKILATRSKKLTIRYINFIYKLESKWDGLY